jgi:hypothetical protein
LTHGRVFDASEAPLADSDGNLPYGGKVQLGGPLNRLHHVEVTVQQMATALDTILDHLQKDPTAQLLFQDESNSKTSTVIETVNLTQLNKDQTDKDTTEDVQMSNREHSGAKRSLSDNSPAKIRHGPDPTSISTPQRSPPTKHERSDSKQTPAEPDCSARERGQP